MTDFLPIGLCNVTYKIVTKDMAIRMKEVLNDVISESQSSFIPGRPVSDNIIVGHECLHTLGGYKSGREGFAALKLDMSKAYDRVERVFLEKIMEKLGFAEGWIERVMHCISSVSFAVNINGESVGRIVPSRGLRQGDPISPYLFLLCAEGLSSLLAEATRLNPAYHGPIISHILFADDSLTFIKADPAECCALKQMLKVYESVSGQCIKFDKSAVCFSPNIVAE